MASITPKLEERAEAKGTEDAFVFTATAKEQLILSEVTSLFRNAQNERNANLEYFDGNNLIEYIDDSVRRFVTNTDEREDIEDWQIDRGIEKKSNSKPEKLIAGSKEWTERVMEKVNEQSS